MSNLVFKIRLVLTVVGGLLCMPALAESVEGVPVPAQTVALGWHDPYNFPQLQRTPEAVCVGRGSALGVALEYIPLDGESGTCVRVGNPSVIDGWVSKAYGSGCLEGELENGWCITCPDTSWTRDGLTCHRTDCTVDEHRLPSGQCCSTKHFDVVQLGSGQARCLVKCAAGEQRNVDLPVPRADVEEGACVGIVTDYAEEPKQESLLPQNSFTPKSLRSGLRLPPLPPGI